MGIASALASIVVVAFLSSSTPVQATPTAVTCVISETVPVNDLIFKVKTNLPDPGHDAVYSIQESRGYVSIPNNRKGVLKLIKNLRELVLGQDNTRRLVVIVVVTLSTGTSETITITFIALKEGFGDVLFNDILPGIKNLVKDDNIFRPISSKYPIYKKLHRILLKSTRRSKSVSRAQVRFLRAIKLLIKKILLSLGVSDIKTRVHLGPEGMLSVERIDELIGATSCINSIDSTPVWPTNPKYRTIDGTFNNLKDVTLGAAETAFVRFVKPRYFDSEGLGEPFGVGDQPNAPDLPNPFKVTNHFIVEQAKSQNNRNGILHMFMQWGQFLDHDMTLAPESEGGDICEDIPCTGAEEDNEDPCYPILGVDGRQCIRLIRSAPVCQRDSDSLKPREQINVNTAFIDGSMIYGSTETVEAAVRDLTGGLGLLRVSGSQGDLLPLDVNELVAPGDFCQDFGGCFLAGDVRANEQAALASIHTLFLRLHNKIARKLKELNPHWDGERIYQETRRIVGALIQKITYEDWLSILIGRGTLAPYTGYKKDVNPGISNAFATAAFRMGHSLIRPTFDALSPSYEPIVPPIPLVQMFFNNTLLQRINADPLLLGLVGNVSQEIDNVLASDLIRRLFERLNSVGLDLGALNIQRARDHGLPGYGTFIKQCANIGQYYNQTAIHATKFVHLKEVIPNKRLRDILEKLYGNPQIIDLWPAGLAEKEIPGTLLGPTFTCLFREQFERVRDGDRFFYLSEDMFTPEQLMSIRHTKLSSIMCLTITNIVSVHKDVFNSRSRVRSCKNIPLLDLLPWKEHPIDCDSKPCNNGGTCRVVVSTTGTAAVRCQCRDGFVGDFCQTTKTA